MVSDGFSDGDKREGGKRFSKKEGSQSIKKRKEKREKGEDKITGYAAALLSAEPPCAFHRDDSWGPPIPRRGFQK